MNKDKRFSFNIDIDFTPKTFWSLIPSININIGSQVTWEFEFLCIGIYINKVNK